MLHLLLVKKNVSISTCVHTNVKCDFKKKMLACKFPRID